MTSALATAGTEARTHPIVIGIGAAATGYAVLGVLAIEKGQLRDHSNTYATLTIVAGVSFVVAGLAAWSRRSERWTGALMVGAGFVLFAGALAEANRSVPFTVGLAVTLIPNAVLAHLVLAFPDGRLHSTLERLLVGSAYLTAIVLQALMLMFMNISNVGGCPCPSNLLFVRDEMNLHATLMNARAIRRYRDRCGSRGRPCSALAICLAAPSPRTRTHPRRRRGDERSARRDVPRRANVLKPLDKPRVGGAPSPRHRPTCISVQPVSRAPCPRGLGDLVVELGRAPEQGRLRDALARALRDPTLELGYWLPDSNEYVDVDGKQVSVTPIATRTVTLLERHGRKVAALVHDAGLHEDAALLDGVSSAAGLALENERLLAELRPARGDQRLASADRRSSRH